MGKPIIYDYKILRFTIKLKRTKPIFLIQKTILWESNTLIVS